MITLIIIVSVLTLIYVSVISDEAFDRFMDCFLIDLMFFALGFGFWAAG
jgi:hypothetical protein